jgi:hypothetical protein
VLFIYTYITRLASNEIFSPSDKIHREVGRAKNLSAPRFNRHYRIRGYCRIWIITAYELRVDINKRQDFVNRTVLLQTALFQRGSSTTYNRVLRMKNAVRLDTE